MLRLGIDRGRLIRDVVITAGLGLVVGTGAVLYVKPWLTGRLQTPRSPVQTVGSSAPPVHLGSAIKGSLTAPVGLVLFSDFDCRYCAALARTVLPSIEQRYASHGTLAVGFRHLPNEAAKEHSLYAAETAVCAAEQGRFWTIHDLLFADGVRLAREYIDDSARRAGLDSTRLAQCLEERALTTVDTDMTAAVVLGLRATPVAFVGRMGQNGTILPSRRIDGAQNLAVFVSAIDAVLAEARK